MASRLQAVIWPWVVATLTLTNVYVLLSGLSPCPAVYLENREEDMEDKIRGIVLERVNQELKSLQEENKKKLKMQSKQAHHLGAMSESPNQTVPFERKDLISSEGNLNLSLKDIDGFTILRKAISLEDVLPLRKWNPEEEVLTFIHIQKAGGSSFQSALMRSKVTQDCTVKCVANAKGLMSFKTRAACPNIKPAVCNKHFDWTVVTEGEQNGFQMAPLILFRDPVMRAVSHFHFFQTLTLARGHKMQCQNVTEYLADRDSMLDTRHLWFDGSVSLTHAPISELFAFQKFFLSKPGSSLF